MAMRPQIPPLTGLRFFAALWIVLYHYSNLSPLPEPLQVIASNGRAGVGLFFVLSGVVMGYNYADAFRSDFSYLRTFAQARFARIYPLYLAALVLATPLSLVATGDTPLPELALSWVLNLVLLHAYVPSDLMHVWNRPAWSLAAEMFFYSLIPFAFRVLGRLSRPAMFVGMTVGLYAIEVAAFAIAVSIFRPVALAMDAPDLARMWMLEYLVYVAPYLRIWEFLIGCVLGAALLRGGVGWLEGRRRRDAALLVAVPGILLISVTPGTGGDLVTVSALATWYVAYTPFFALLLLALASGETFLSCILRSRPLQILGESSYALYLTHSLIFTYVWFLKGSPALIAIAVLFSVECYRLIEIPARKALRPTPLQS